MRLQYKENKYDVELRAICCKYGILLNKSNSLYDLFINTLLDIWNQLTSSDIIAIYGCGEAFYHIIGCVDISSRNVVCIIENDTEVFSNTFNIPIINMNSAKNYYFNKVILTGYNSRVQMRFDIQLYDPSIEVIDIYQVLETQGVEYIMPFFYLESDHKDYYYLERSRQIYIDSKTREDSKTNLKQLICDYLDCRDFVSAGKYIKEYINMKFDDSESFLCLESDLLQYYSRIRSSVTSHKNRNVFVFIIDAMSLRMSNSSFFLNNLSKESISFTKAYSPSWHTRSSTYGLFTGMNYVEDGYYKIPELSKENCNFLREMHSTGVKVKHISTPYHRFLVDIHQNCFSYMQPRLYWSLLMDVVSESSDCIYFSHSIYETHSPFLSGDPSVPLCERDELEYYGWKAFEIPDGYPERVRCLRDDSLEYVSTQLEFYLSFLDTDTDSIVITSDHWEWNIFSKELGVETTEDMFRVPLIIHSKSIKPFTYEHIYSTVDMPSILRQLIAGRKTLEFTGFEYARQEIEPIYNIDVLAERTPDNPFYPHCGEIHFTTDTECYKFHLDGREEFYLLSDPINLINDESYKERISYFRSKINIDTREVWMFMFNKYPLLKEFHKERVDELLNVNKNPGLKQ